MGGVHDLGKILRNASQEFFKSFANANVTHTHTHYIYLSRVIKSENDNTCNNNNYYVTPTYLNVNYYQRE